MGVRIFAVGVLVSGIGAGLTAGYLAKSGDTLTVRESAATQQFKGQETLELPPPNTNNPQPLPVGARTKQVQADIAAAAKAKAQAKLKADAARRLAKARADRAAKERASRAAEREQGGYPDGGGGEQPPAAHVECTSLSGHRQTGCTLMVTWAKIPSNQFNCLDRLWKRESGWSPRAHNKSSGAHGIPQALPGKKMAVYGADWFTNPVPQIKWGLMYIKKRYGTPCSAWGHSERVGWY
jgi:hypothetical protein